MITKVHPTIYFVDGPHGEQYRIWYNEETTRFNAEIYNFEVSAYVWDLELSELLSTLPEAEALVYFNTWDISETKQVLAPRAALHAVVEYLWRSEEKDYEECGKPEHHIFHSIKALAEVLHDETK
jgi:hypothetical protein